MLQKRNSCISNKPRKGYHACLVWILGFLQSLSFAQSLPAPLNLRTDWLLHPDRVSQSGILSGVALAAAVRAPGTYQYAALYNRHPLMHWELDTAIKKQYAYRIQLASESTLLTSGHPDIWDPGKKLGHTNTIRYNGPSLHPEKIYYWRVQVWDASNHATAFSDIQAFYLSDTSANERYAHYPLYAEWQNPVQFRQMAADTFFADFGKDAFAQVQLHLNSPVTDSIWIEVAEATDAPGMLRTQKGNIRYTRQGILVKKGDQIITVIWPENEKRNSRNPARMPATIGEVYPFRYLRITHFKGILAAGDLRRKAIHYAFNEQAASFTSSNPVLNQVWDLCKYTVKATSFTGYYVDGDRERLPYEADALINQLSHYSVDAEYTMARRTMAFLIYHPTWPTEWSLQNVLLAWNDYLYTGDDIYIREFYPELQKKILMPLAGNNGLISTRTGKQTDAFLHAIHIDKIFDGKRGLKDNVDWPQRGSYIGPEKEYGGETDGFVYCTYNAVVNAYYYHCLGLMQKIATVLGKSSDAKQYGTEREKVYHAYQQVFTDSLRGLVRDGDTTRHCSLHSNMFALAFGLIPESRRQMVTNYIKSRGMACSVYGAEFLLQALYDAGEADYALQLMASTAQRSWYNMLRVGSTLTMEAWDLPYKPNLDWNHAWGTAPANIIPRNLMGVQPLTPGYASCRIRPYTNGLSYARLRTPTPQGAIELGWTKTAGEVRMQVTLPGNTQASFEIPELDATQPVWLDGKPVSVHLSGGRYLLGELSAGKHDIHYTESVNPVRMAPRSLNN
ncbi:MAG TPA: alpha-L-rhamnosidase C-terminal domain-containing protein [Sediminibacterium sp.]|nr:alpha-L-rhamnosidase C-terminal domain-containing protein [Sediminibacterium sp.]